MDDSISRKAVMDAINAMPVMIDADGIEYVEKSCMTIRIEILPAVQPEVIRCKDCIHMQRDILFDDVWCGHVKGKISICENDYCSSAERKDDDKTQSDL